MSGNFADVGEMFGILIKITGLLRKNLVQNFPRNCVNRLLVSLT